MRTLGRYELLQPLARGGMAEVYLARRRVAGVEKRLVIKRLRRERISDPRFLDLFVKEAQLSMTLVQQNIVPVFDFGRIGDDVFLAMEHIDGKDLGSTLARARGHGMPILPAVFVAVECCHALHHAHSGASGRNVVHRDVTPRNVLLSWSGEVKLADFGIASAMGAGDSSLVGTPGYMAPEQARGEPLDARADLYALGLVLWEMLTGEHVRRGADSAALLDAAKRNQLPEIPSDLPPALAELLRRATATDPVQRVASARDMADELDAFMVAERARRGGAAPAQQLSTWLRERWAGARDEEPELPELGGRMVTFLDDGAAGVLGTGTLRSMAVTAAPPDEEAAGSSSASSTSSTSSAASASSTSSTSSASSAASASSTDEVMDPRAPVASRGFGAPDGSDTADASGARSEAAAALGLPALARVAQRVDDAPSASAAPGAPRRRAVAAAVAIAVLATLGVAWTLLGRGPRLAPLDAAAPAVDPPAVATRGAGDLVAPAPAAAADAAPVVDASVALQVVGVDAASKPLALRGGLDARARPSGARREAPDARVRVDPTAADPGASAGAGSVATPVSVRRRQFTIGAKPWAHVTIDGETQRHETPATLSLTVGPHKLRFENPELGLVREVVIEVMAEGPGSYVQVLE